MMEIEKISQEKIKPSYPTPSNLKHHKLSLLDQLAPDAYSNILVFFPSDSETRKLEDVATTTRTKVLKQSLSETLTLFYPFAGTINRENLLIDCNDAGVPYIEAKVNCSLNDYLENLDILSLPNFFPSITSDFESHVLVVQENVFTCGGHVVCCTGWHLIIDAASFGNLLKTWSALARKSNEEALVPNFMASSIFPQDKSLPSGTNHIVFLSRVFKFGNCAKRRFFFDGSVIAKLKHQVTSSSTTLNPTRVEVVVAKLVQLIMSAMKKRFGIQKQTLLSFMVNLRRRAIPPLPETCVGNIVILTALSAKGDGELNDLVCEIKKATTKIDGDFVKSLQGEEGTVKLIEATKELHELLSDDGSYEHIGFNSWCNLELYDLDFGWGNPSWVPFISPDFKNSIGLIDTKHGNGLEAWVNLDEDVMTLFEQNEELHSLASMDQSPLHM